MDVQLKMIIAIFTVLTYNVNMQRLKLKVEKRKVLGKAVKKIRREGLLPGNIYGKDVKSTAVQADYKEFEKIFKETGETGLIDLQFEEQTKPVLIHNVQFQPINKTPLHADFYQVNLKEKIKTMVPVEVVGEAKAVVEKIGLLMQTLSEIEVEALPEDLPEKLEVNVENLAAIDEQIMVGDLKIPSTVSVLSDPSQVVLKITELVSKEAEEQAAAEEAAAQSAKSEAEEETETKEGNPEAEAEPEQKEKTEGTKETKEEKPKN